MLNIYNIEYAKHSSRLKRHIQLILLSSTEMFNAFPTYNEREWNLIRVTQY